MPKSYSDKERRLIIKDLRCAALELMSAKGIKGTTVDELVAKARIPKGTFYLFYKSKELLLYDAIMETHDGLHDVLEVKLRGVMEHLSVDSLTDVLYEAFSEGFNLGILQLMISGDLEMLIRKLPDDIVEEHLKNDDDFFTVFKVLFPHLKEETLNEYSAAFRALFFTASYKREIGENFDSALKLLIRGLILQMMEATK